MTQENKDLLLKDLCGRLPYGVKMNHIADDEYSPNTLIGIAKDMITLEGLGGYECVNVEHYKPYLFPMSSMTEEQRYEISSGLQNIHTEHPPFGKIENSGSDNCLECVTMASTWLIEYYNKNHLDYRGLIPIDLAIDCTNLNIYQS